MNRLARFTVFGTPGNRQLVTTDSFDLPVPNMLVTDEFRRIIADLGTRGITVGTPRSITELLALRLLHADVPANRVNAEIKKMLSPDLVMGLRMDINRPFGNGRDDNANGVVDQANAYYEYEVLLDTTQPRNPFVVSPANTMGWVQIRIPVRSWTRQIGSPLPNNVRDPGRSATNRCICPPFKSGNCPGCHDPHSPDKEPVAPPAQEAKKS